MRTSTLHEKDGGDADLPRITDGDLHREMDGGGADLPRVTDGDLHREMDGGEADLPSAADAAFPVAKRRPEQAGCKNGFLYVK